MSDIEAALLEVAARLEETGTPYMAIGGFAVSLWGRSRLTEDIDVTVWVAVAKWPEFVENLSRSLRPLAGDPVAFALETHIVPVRTQAGPRADIVLATHPYLEQAIRRAPAVSVSGRMVRICAAEDLILHKLVSDRPRDHEDAESVFVRQGKALDRAYLDRLVDQLASTLERPEILTFYRSCLKKAGIEPS